MKHIGALFAVLTLVCVCLETKQGLQTLYPLEQLYIKTKLLDGKVAIAMDIVSPRIPGNTFPVIVFLSGMDEDILPGFGVSRITDATAGHGHIFVIVTLTFTQIAEVSGYSAAIEDKIFPAIIKWLHDNLKSIMQQKIPGVTADLENGLILMAHSGAGHTITRFLN